MKRSQIARLDNEKLVQLWKNAVMCDDRPRADPVQACAESELAGREFATDGYITWVGPSIGVFAALGYHVGHTQGCKQKLRRKILDRIFVIELPLVHSVHYMSEWGCPGSMTRYHKIFQTLSGLIKNSSDQIGKRRAVREWAEDLEYVRENFLDQAA